jgi:Fic family protein
MAMAGSAAHWQKKSPAQNLGQPSLIALACTIERKRKDYHAALERNNKDIRISDWLNYFAATILDAQNNTTKRVDFYVAKAKFHARLRGRMNARQEKVIGRMFREGIDGFKGGLSAENYIAVTQTSRATATRDLQSLVGIRQVLPAAGRTDARQRRHPEHRRSPQHRDTPGIPCFCQRRDQVKQGSGMGRLRRTRE